MPNNEYVPNPYYYQLLVLWQLMPCKQYAQRVTLGIFGTVSLRQDYHLYQIC